MRRYLGLRIPDKAVKLGISPPIAAPSIVNSGAYSGSNSVVFEAVSGKLKVGFKSEYAHPTGRGRAPRVAV